MSDVRLTQQMRDQIAHQMLIKRFKPEEEALKKEESEVGDKIYFLMFPDWELLELSPKEWFESVGGMRFYSSGESRYIAFTHPRRIWHDHPSQLKGEARKLADALDRKKEALKESRNTLAAKIDATLRSFHTVDKLVKEWPEAKPFIPKGLVTSALAVPITSLNAQLGLP